MDLDYYKKIFSDKKFLDFIKKSERDKILALLKIQQDFELTQEGANSNEIKKNYTNLAKNKCAESDKGYDDIKDIIDMLCTLVPYTGLLLCYGLRFDNIQSYKCRFGNFSSYAFTSI